MDDKKEKLYLNAADVQAICNVKANKAYAIIKKLNAELEKLGKYTLQGKVPSRFFFEKFYL